MLETARKIFDDFEEEKEINEVKFQVVGNPDLPDEDYNKIKEYVKLITK